MKIALKYLFLLFLFCNSHVSFSAEISDKLMKSFEAAFEANDLTTLEKLLNGDSFILYKKDQFGNTPIHTAVAKNRINIIKSLIKKKRVNLFLTDSVGNTLLHTAVFNQHKEMATLLLEKGEKFYNQNSVNETNKSGMTALHYATSLYFQSQIDNTYMVELLLKHGANPNPKDGYGLTPIDHAKAHKYKNHKKIIKILNKAIKEEKLTKCRKAFANFKKRLSPLIKKQK